MDNMDKEWAELAERIKNECHGAGLCAVQANQVWALGLKTYKEMERYFFRPYQKDEVTQ